MVDALRPDDPAALGCEATAERMERFAEGGPPPSALERAHARACDGCGARYRAAVESAARAARAGHRRALEGVDDLPAARPRRLLAWPSPRGARGSFLRLLLGPAIVVALVTRLPGVAPAEEPLVVQALAGEVALDRAPLEHGARLRLSRNGVLRSGGAGRALVTDGACELELGAESALLVETIRPPRLRLARGELELRGRVVVTCELGVLELEDGRARLRLDARGGELACTKGALVWTDARGARRVAAGESVGLGERDALAASAVDSRP